MFTARAAILGMAPLFDITQIQQWKKLSESGSLRHCNNSKMNVKEALFVAVMLTDPIMSKMSENLCNKPLMALVFF